MEIMTKHIDNKMITCNNKDAPWVTSEVKTAIRRNSRVYRKWVNRGRNPNEQDRVRVIRNITNKIIKEAKLAYYTNLGNKLSTPDIGHRHFWTAYKKLAFKKADPNIPPIVNGGEYISKCKDKVRVFNEYFANQCTINENGSTLPDVHMKTNTSLNYISVTTKNITDIINSLGSHKAHGHDGISVSMLKLCANEVAVPLQIIFRDCVSSGMFPNLWKCANVQPIHKKDNRQKIGNYRPISLLPICAKIFEKIIFDQVYEYLDSNNLLSINQSGFRPGDSTINQLLSITTTIYNAFENHDETRAIFLDISKAFDKVWHEGLLYKLKCNGISDSLFTLLGDYLTNRYQRVVLNGHVSDWMMLNAGVPQGSVLGPLLFLVYINDLTDNISSDMRLFADDSSLFTCVKGVDDTQLKLVQDLNTIANWGYQWKMTFNPDISKQAIEIIFSCKAKKPSHPSLTFNDIPIARKSDTRHLGVYLDE